MPRWGGESHQLFRKGKSVTILTVGIDLAKSVFAVHGRNEEGKAELLRPAVPRTKLLELSASLPPCVIAMEACSGAHHWAREFAKFRYEHIKLTAQVCRFALMKEKTSPFVRRQTG